MQAETITLSRNNFHMRPLALINSIAAFFPDHCKMFILYKSNRYNLRSFMNLVNFIIAFVEPPFCFEIQAEANDENTEKFSILILKAVFNNIQRVFFTDSSLKRSREEESEAYKNFFTCTEKELDNNNEIAESDKERFIQHLRNILGLKKCRKKAVLHSVKGMHVVPCTQLRLISSLLNCKITLDCTNKNGEPQGCDITDIMGLLNLSVPDGSAIFINSEGKNCDESADIIKYILEHIDTTMAEWQIHSSDIDKNQWGNNLLNFIRNELKQI